MRWLITGASGTLGAYLLRELRGETVFPWSGSTASDPFVPVDLADHNTVAAAYRAAKPDVIIHAGAFARVDACFREPARARNVNAGGTEQLCELAAGARLVFVSTDLVFDGEHAPYRETDAPAPLSVYGRSKMEAETAVLAAPNGVVARLSLMFGPARNGRPGFFDSLFDAVRTGRPFTLFADEWRTLLGLQTAAQTLLTLARSDVTGVLHIGGPERMSRLDMGRRLAQHLGASDTNLTAGERNSPPQAEPRPRDVSLDSSRWRSLFPKLPWPSFETSLADMLNP